MIFKKILFFAAFLFTTILMAQENAIGSHVKIRLLAPRVFSTNEETLVGVYFELDPHWHVYWKNPGDSGAAPKFKFSTQNVELGPVLWPVPVRLPIAHLTNIGYEKSVAYLFGVRPKGNQEVLVDLDLEWLVCKEECIPGFAKLRLKRPVHSEDSEWNPSDLEILKKFAVQLPTEGMSSPLSIEIVSAQEDTLKLVLKSKDNNFDYTKIDIFPISGDFISPSAPKKNNNEFLFKLIPGMKIKPQADFLVVKDYNYWEFNNIPLATSPSLSVESDSNLWSLILLAFIGGFLLNLMPCVFPVIFIKAFSLLKTQGSERIRDCLWYSLGVLVTFSALGLIFLILKQLGAAVGWGFQLQSPPVIFSLILLFWLMGFNFLGVFKMGTTVMNWAGNFSKSSSSSFMTGILSVFVAAPCTGPFMGTALGSAAMLPAWSALTIFLSLGLGLAFPFLLFALFPRTLSWLPKPGAWMESLKQFLAFPLFATVLWLLWVLSQQTEWIYAGVALLILSFAVWLKPRLKSRQQIGLILSVSILFIYLGTHLPQSNKVEIGSSLWIPYDEQKLAEVQAQGQAVFVDFTAAWCITCQVNKQLVLDTTSGQAAFKKLNVFLMRADWTGYNPAITHALTKLGRNSVPVYAFYPANGGEVKILPQLLTLQMIENLSSN